MRKQKKLFWNIDVVVPHGLVIGGCILRTGIGRPTSRDRRRLVGHATMTDSQRAAEHKLVVKASGSVVVEDCTLILGLRLNLSS